MEEDKLANIGVGSDTMSTGRWPLWRCSPFSLSMFIQGFSLAVWRPRFILGARRRARPIAFESHAFQFACQIFSFACRQPIQKLYELSYHLKPRSCWNLTKYYLTSCRDCAKTPHNVRYASISHLRQSTSGLWRCECPILNSG